MEKGNSKKEYAVLKFSLRSFAVGVILAVTFLLFFIDGEKTYVSSINILVVPKSTLAANSQDGIMANLQQFPKMLSFYEKLLASNPDINDPAVGQSLNSRKQLWDSMVEVRRPDPNSSILQVSIKAKNQADAQALSQMTARTLIDTASQYYNINTDIDFRIIEGPITRTHVFGIWWILPLSIILGFLIALALENIVSFAGSMPRPETAAPEKKAEVAQNLEENLTAYDQESNDHLDDLYKSEEADVPFSFDQYTAPHVETPLPTKEMEDINKSIEKNMYPNFPEMPVSASQTASAPDNLPIADDSVFASGFQQADEVVTPPAAAKQTSEPTEEDLKARLNQLLKGEL